MKKERWITCEASVLDGDVVLLGLVVARLAGADALVFVQQLDADGREVVAAALLIINARLVQRASWKERIKSYWHCFGIKDMSIA